MDSGETAHMVSTLGIALLWAQGAIGFSGHHAAKAGCCDVCGVETARVVTLIQTLQTCPRWRVRDDAAHDLRKFDPACHPEVVNALAVALLTDCEEEVREEAAQSLKKLGACTPEAHVALRKAADCDRDFCTRFWAKRALATMKRKCDGPCVVCRPGTVVVGSPQIVVGEPALIPENPAVVPALPPDPMPTLPPSEVPPAPDRVSPFNGPGEPALIPPRESKRPAPEERKIRVVRLPLLRRGHALIPLAPVTP